MSGVYRVYSLGGVAEKMFTFIYFLNFVVYATCDFYYINIGTYQPPPKRCSATGLPVREELKKGVAEYFKNCHLKGCEGELPVPAEISKYFMPDLLFEAVWNEGYVLKRAIFHKKTDCSSTFLIEAF